MNDEARSAMGELPRLPVLPVDAHKGTAGRILCVAGSRSMPGAAVLVARAAQRAGAGLVCMGALDHELFAVLPVAAPEAVLVDLTAEFPTERQPPRSAARRLRARDPHARLIGPGIGDDGRARRVVELALGIGEGAVADGEDRDEAARPLILDADALNALDGEPEILARRGGRALVVTPHPGEAARLAGASVPRDEAGRRAFAQELARRAACIVCLKGAGTVVSDGERTWVNPTGNSGMASAGAGDVLAGILTAYAACTLAAGGGAGAGAQDEHAGLDLWDACRLAVFVHGWAGDLAAAELGPRAVIASDLVRFLPRAQRELEAGAG